MPEGDTVRRTARRLHEALAGRVVTRFDLRWGSLAEVDLTGSATVEVIARGKHLLHRFDSGHTLHSHLRMEGQWRIDPTDALTSRMLGNQQIRAVVGAERWTATGLLLGMLDLVPTASEHALVGHLGPDLLGPDWDADIAIANLNGWPTTIGSALLDQRNLAGIGTYYASESLFIQGVNPWQHARETDPAHLRALVDLAQRLLDTNRHYATQSTTGIRREGSTCYVHARSGLPCRRCGNPIRVHTIGTPSTERAMFYCPTCQDGLAPGDNGRLQRPFGTSRPSRSRPSPPSAITWPRSSCQSYDPEARGGRQDDG